MSDPDAEVERGQPGYDKLQKVRPLITLLSEQIEAQYNLSRDVAIDEAMIPFKGRLSFKQYIKAKPTKRGIKVFVLAEPSTGYEYRFNIYTGKR